MSDQIYITRLEITDFKGLRFFEAEPEQVTVLAGPNASGKTSAIEAIQAALRRGGIPAEAIRKDAKRSEIRISLSNGLEVLRRRTKGGSTKLEVTRDGMPVRNPQELLTGLTMPINFDPVAWLESTDRTQALLDAMPLSITTREIARLAKEAGLDDAPPVQADAHALQVLAELEKWCVNERRDLNREAKRMKAWIESETVELSEAEDPSDEIEAAQGEVAKIEAKFENMAETIANVSKLSNSAVFAKEQAEAKSKMVDSLREQLRYAENELKSMCSEAQRLAKEFHEADAKLTSSGFNRDEALSKLSEAKAELSALREKRGAWNAANERRGRLSAAKEELSETEAQARAFDRGVQLFRDEPAALMARTDLPINGLEYRDGKLYLNSVDVDQLSGAETVRLAAKIAIHLVRKAGSQFVLVDGLEKLDDDYRAAMLEEVRGSGIQWIFTEVGERQSDEGETVIVMGEVAE